MSRSPLRSLARWALSRWPRRVRAGEARGLRMDLRRASAWYARGTNEPAIQRAVAEHVRPGGVFFDVGANVGFFSLIAARAAGPAGRIIAFEPVPANADAIRRNARINRFDSISVVQAAVASAPGEMDLVLSEHPGGAALALAPPPDASGRIRARVVSIDDLVGRGQAPPPTLIKVDVEGVEVEALRGMAETARTHRPIIICELDDTSPAALARKVAEVEGLFAQWGYAASRLEEAYGGSVVHLLARPATAQP
ncbi:MAG: FkbM family methyltransferase [Phycisphaerales bacterium]